MCTRVDGHTYPTPTHLNYTLFHPVGVCALISPWNVPFMTATWKVAPCLAFGNTAVLKMSELSPMTAARLGDLALEAGVPAGVLNIVHGYGKEAGEPLVSHRDVRAISFTGSTVTGNRIVQSAGLKKFSMELGGKSPFVIFEDADLDRALDAAIFMIFSNNGERRTTTVLDYLREQMHRTGTKEGCAEGDCGACVVMVGELNAAGTGVDYVATNACIQLLPSLDGKSVKTVESLKKADGTLHPVQ
eukprot:gene67-91_t